MLGHYETIVTCKAVNQERKGENEMAKNIKIEPIKETTMSVKLVGDTDLILNGRSRQYVMSEVWKQSHDKGSEMPAIYRQSKNMWEQRITSIHWKNPIEYHDDDISLYTEEEWNKYMNENQPCILAMAFAKSFKECFLTFFRDSTGKKGTDLSRALNMGGSVFPIDFASVRIEDSIVPTTGLGSTSVISSVNVFSGWSCEIVVSCADIVFPPETLVSIINTAGKYIGIGTQRSNGFGRYHIESIKAI